MYNNAYREKLLDKRWEIKRNQILKRDNFHCVICGNSKYLVVHHKQYHYSKILNRFFDPWDYKDSYLHAIKEDMNYITYQFLTSNLKNYGILEFF